MDTESTDTTQDRSAAEERTITVDVPEDRVPEFYAWYAHFLAGERRRGHRGRGPRGRHGRCGCRGGHEGRTQDSGASEAASA